MSAPTEEQSEQLLVRLANTLNEWDDARYILSVQLPDGGFVTASRCSDRDKLVLIRCLMEQVLERPQQ